MKKKQMNESSNEWRPTFAGKYSVKMSKCKSVDEIFEILKQIECEIGTLPDMISYINAIRKAADLKDYSGCFRVFESAKSVQRVDVSLYTAMIWVCSQQQNIRNGINLLVEMQTIYSLTPSISIFNQLLSLCLKTMEYGKAKQILKDLKNSTQTAPNIRTYNLMMDLRIKSGEIHKAVSIFENLQNGKYGDLKPNYVIYTTLIRAFCEEEKIETAQKLFDDAMRKMYQNTAEHTATHKKEIMVMTQCLLNGFANIGAVDETVEFIKAIMDKSTHKQLDFTHFPFPNGQMFTCILKALTRSKGRIEHNSVWQIIEWTMECMKVLKIEKDAVFYGNLLVLCGDIFGNADIEKALFFYKEMKQNNVKPGQLQIFNLLKTGQQYHHHHKTHNAERRAFIKYILNELQQNDIVPSPQIRKLVTKMMGTMDGM